MDYKEKVIALLNSQELSKEQKEKLELIFPELRESEDEKIRKDLIIYLRSILSNKKYGDKFIEGWIAWLEKQGEHANFLSKIQVGDKVTRNEDGVLVNLSQLKRVAKPADKQGEQNLVEFKPLFRVGDVIKPKDPVLGEPRIIKGIHPKFGYDTNNGILDFEFEDNWKLVEQKPANKVEPKFKVGDWINGYYTNYKVLSANNEGYVVEDIDGNKINILFENEKFHHLWTIQDAKDGDVLADNVGVILFKSIRGNNVINYYAYLSGFFAVQEGEKYWGSAVNCTLSPATKGQRERFFAAMHDAGYEWNAEKKELKKIEQKPTDKEMKELLRTEYEKGRADVIAEMQKPWSEEDELKRTTLIDVVKKQRGSAIFEGLLPEELTDWLESLKERVQPEQEWSEEDERILSLLLNNYKQAVEHRPSSLTHAEVLDIYNFLKSLRPQKQWKPSDEQMIAIQEAMNIVGILTITGSKINSLYQDLKKLRKK